MNLKSSENTKAVLFTLLATSTLTVMSGATISPALPTMQAHFADIENIELWVRLVLTIPALFIVIGAPFAGKFIDKYPKKRFLLFCITLYAFAGSSGLFLDELYAILIGRALLGLAVAGIMTTVITLFADYYQGGERSRALGLQSSFMALGGVLFLSFGGLLADYNWRAPFAIYLFAILFLPLAWKFLYEPKNEVSEQKNHPPRNLKDSPNLVKILIFVYGLMLLAQIIFYTIPIHLPFYLQNLTSASGTESGLAIALVTLSSGITSFMYGKFKDHFGYIYVMCISLALLGTGYSIISQAGGYSILVIGLTIIGIGFGFFMPNVNTWLAEIAPVEFRGRIMGGITTAVFLGQFLSPIATQPINMLLTTDELYLLCGIALIIFTFIILSFRKKLLKTASLIEN